MSLYLFSAIILIILHIILYIYFFYTIVGIFKGAAFIPSSHIKVEKMLDLAQLKADELVLDLGSGDGRILVAATRRGARAIGIEINPLLCLASRFIIMLGGYRNVTIRRESFWDVNLSEVDVLTVYLVPQRMEELHTKIKAEMKKGSRVVATQYPFPNWEYDSNDGTIYLYRV